MSAKIYLEHGYYDDATNTWHTGPSAVLKALEEQASEVLDEYFVMRQRDETDRLVSGLPFDKAKSPWINVEDQPPPKDGDAVLCRDPQGLHFLAWWVEDFGQWYDEAEGEYYDELPVEIEWMPIPA